MILTKANLRKSNLHCLATCIYFASKTENLEINQWIGHVILNRLENKLFPNKIYKVVFQKFQFTFPIYKNGFNIDNIFKYNTCLTLAKSLLTRTIDITNGALYFYSIDLNTPLSRTLQIKKIIDNYKFLGY